MPRDPAKNAKGEPERNFFRVSHKMMDQPGFSDLSLKAKVLYLYLCKYRNHYGKDSMFYRSLRSIQDDTGMTKATIIKARQELKDNWIISLFKDGRKTMKYHIAE